MSRLRALSWALVGLVLVPAGALAWIGYRSADAWDAAVAASIVSDLDAVENRLGPLLQVETRKLEGLVRSALAAEAEGVRRALPRGEPGAAVRALWGRSLELPGDPPARVRVLTARLLDASGRGIYPAEFTPSDRPPDLRDWTGLLDSLRRQADARLYGDGDLEAARAVWREAALRTPRADRRAALAVEAARLDVRTDGGSDAAQRVLERLEANWSSDALRGAGRSQVLLWIEAGASERIFDALVDAFLDAVRLTPAERRRALHLAAVHARRMDATGTGQWQAPGLGAWFQVGLLRDWRSEYPLPLGAPVAHGAELRFGLLEESLWTGLEARIQRPGGGGPVEVRITRDDVWREPWSVVREGVEFERQVPVAGPFGSGGRVFLRHARAADTLRTRATRRLITSVGVAALVALMGVGLVLVRRAVARERAARQLRDDFVANVSHELRTPLTAVCLHAEMLAEGDPPAERRRSLAHVVRAEGARLAALVDDLLDFAALERGARRIEPEPVDLARAVEEAAAPYAILAEAEGVELSVDVPPGTEMPALADAAGLSRVLTNLLSNAWRHGRPSRDGHPGRIRISARAGPRPAVEVRDDGPGIPAAERAAIFERFRRGSGSTRVEGSGVGLALSRELARAMDGDLQIGDDLRQTVFRLTLPPVPTEAR